MEKELYLLIGAGLGSLVTITTTVINNRAQLRLVRENYEHQSRIEGRKLASQQRKESLERIRVMLEEAQTRGAQWRPPIRTWCVPRRMTGAT
jgi:hypothetical protein